MQIKSKIEITEIQQKRIEDEYFEKIEKRKSLLLREFVNTLHELLVTTYFGVRFDNTE